MKTELTPKPLLQRQLEQFLWDLCAYDTEFEAAIGDRNIDDVVKPYYEELISVKDEQPQSDDAEQPVLGAADYVKEHYDDLSPEHQEIIIQACKNFHLHQTKKMLEGWTDQEIESVINDNKWGFPVDNEGNWMFSQLKEFGRQLLDELLKQLEERYE